MYFVHTAIFKIDNQQGPTVYNMQVCSMFCNKWENNLEKNGYMELNYFAIHLRVTLLFYSPPI